MGRCQGTPLTPLGKEGSQSLRYRRRHSPCSASLAKVSSLADRRKSAVSTPYSVGVYESDGGLNADLGDHNRKWTGRKFCTTVIQYRYLCENEKKRKKKQTLHWEPGDWNQQVYV